MSSEVIAVGNELSAPCDVIHAVPFAELVLVVSSFGVPDVRCSYVDDVISHGIADVLDIALNG